MLLQYGEDEMQYYGTLGPACKDTETLAAMFRAGMTGVRLNMSHGNLDENGHWIHRLFQAAELCGLERPQVLIDLRGPELRLGSLEEEIMLQEGDCAEFGKDKIPVPDMFLQYAECGDRFLADDGRLEFEVVSFSEDRRDLTARTVRSGILKSGKSLALIGKELPMPTLTENDYRNISMAAEYGVTGVMQPFVRNQQDLITLRSALNAVGADHIEIFAKIENLQGVHALDELLPYCDHVVIARGDLGNAMPLYKLPGVQKRIAARCREAGKPFMVVTQMLDSMHERAVPTRAEVLDIYNAVLDGASSLMLTGETAAGKFPAEAMDFLVKTGKEASQDYRAFSACSLFQR